MHDSIYFFAQKIFSEIRSKLFFVFIEFVILQILFALLSGEKLALWSVEERKSLGKDLLKKLNLLRVCMQKQDASWKTEQKK